MIFEKHLRHFLTVLSRVKSGLCDQKELLTLVLLESHLGAESVVPELAEVVPVFDGTLRDRIRHIEQRPVRVSFVTEHQFLELDAIDFLIGTQHGSSHD